DPLSLPGRMAAEREDLGFLRYVPGEQEACRLLVSAEEQDPAAHPWGLQEGRESILRPGIIGKGLGMEIRGRCHIFQIERPDRPHHPPRLSFAKVTSGGRR